MSEETFRPTGGMADAAKRALRWIEEGHAGSGFTDVGRRRASQLANREAVSFDTVKRMYSFFARHEVDKKGKDFNNLKKPSPGRVAWDAWGGDPGFSWSRDIVESRSDKMTDTRIFARIVKTDKQSDGTLLVTGVATDSSVDSDEQVCDGKWLKAAMPEWFRWGNIREQHSNIAAGVATEYEERDGQHWITARVVAAESVKKVEMGVLKGFSIGIRGPRVVRDEKAAGGRIVDGQIVEVSLVDRPANPVCTLSLAKTVNGTLSPVEILEKAVDEVTSEQTGAEATAEQTVEESAQKAAEESTMEQTGEESTMAGKADEESSQPAGEESSRPSGVAGKGEDQWDKMHGRLDMIERMCKEMYDKMCGDTGDKSITEDIRKAVDEVAAKVSVLEKTAATTVAPVRTAVAATPQPKNDALTKAAEYRAKAMNATNSQLAQGYLALAIDLEKSA